MSQTWKRRQRATRALVSSIADSLLSKGNVSSDQLYGLCKLTWITADFQGNDAGYIASTKLPALKHIFGDEIPRGDLSTAATIVAQQLGERNVAKLVRGHTGITNFRNAYRNTSHIWLEENRIIVIEIIRRARRLKSDAEGAKLAAMIDGLPGIARTIGDVKSLRKAAGLLTPVVFALDPRFRFPMINGNPGVRKLLKQAGVSGSGLIEQHDMMVAMLGRRGIKDAGDLDLYGQKLLEIQTGSSAVLTKKLEQGSSLKVKDDRDVEVIAKARTIERKRLHNRMTNSFRDLYKEAYTLTEGNKGAAMYDVEVEAFNGKDRLLIEAKSSTDEADVRMAIGQLFAYSYHLKRSDDDCQAVLLPQRPNQTIMGLIDSLEMGLMWFEDDSVVTETKWLKSFVAAAGASKDPVGRRRKA